MIRYKKNIVILSLAILPCSLSAQEVVGSDTLKVNPPEMTEQTGNVPGADLAPSLPEKLSFDGTDIPSPELTYINPISNFQYFNPQLPFGIQGIATQYNFIGLGATNSISFLRDFNYGGFSATGYFTVQKHFYDYKNTAMMTAGAQLSYAFNSNWSVTAFGQYVSSYAAFRPAVQAMMPVSGFGGYFTYDMDRFSISGGVRRDFNPYTMSWETNPVIIPTIKVGRVDIGVDIGPMVKKGVMDMRRDNVNEPPSPPGGRRR